MRWVGLVLIGAIAMGAGPATQPATTRPARTGPRTLHAMVAGVEPNAIRVSLLRKNALLRERRVRVGFATVITLNHKPATLSALHAGENVTITMNHGVATRIDATGK